MIDWRVVGTVFPTNFNGDCTVVSAKSCNNIVVMFSDGTEVQVRSGNLTKGIVKNPNNAKIFGVGCNDIGETNTKLYTVWHSMIRRCYSEVFHKQNKAYRDVTVQESWKRFSNFKRDVETLPFYSYCESHGYELDKDILTDGTRMYKLETVCFVPKEINAVLIKEVGVNGRKGYHINSHGNYSISTTRELNEIRKELGLRYSFKTAREASEVYRLCKKERIRKLANKWKDQIDARVYEALMNYQVEITD